MQARYAVLGVVLILVVITGVLIYQGNNPSTPSETGTTTTVTETSTRTHSSSTGATSHATSPKSTGKTSAAKTTSKTLPTNATPSHITSSPGYHQSAPPSARSTAAATG